MSQSHDHNHNFEQKKKALTPLNTPAGQSLLKRLADKGRHFNRREQEDAAEETNTQTPNDLMIERETTHSPAQSPEIKTIDSPATVSTEDKPTSATLTDVNDTTSGDTPISSDETTHPSTSPALQATTKASVPSWHSRLSEMVNRVWQGVLGVKKIKHHAVYPYLRHYGFYAIAAVLLIIAVTKLMSLDKVATEGLSEAGGLSHHSASFDALKTPSATIDTLQSELDELLVKVTAQSNTNPDKEAILNQLSQLTQEFQDIRITNTKAFEGLQEKLYQQQNDMAAQLQSIASSINLIQHALQPVNYIDSRALPFELVSIDVIEGNPLVSVNYNHTTIPLEAGFNLAGWQLLTANYENQTAEFIQAVQDTENSPLSSIPHVKVGLNNSIHPEAQ